MSIEEVLALFGVTKTPEEVKEIIKERKIFVGEGEFIPKSRFDEVNTQVKDIKTQVEERDGQIATLKASAKGNDELTKKIEELEASNKKASEEYANRLAEFKLGSAIDQELLSAGARDVKAVRATLDLTDITLDKNGKVQGLSELVDNSKKDKSFLWNLDKSKDEAGKGIDKQSKTTESEWADMRKIR